MDPVLEFGIEAACLTGLVLLGAVVSGPKFGAKRWDRAMWIRATGVLVVGLGYFFVNPRGWPDPFPVVIGCTVIVVVTVGLFLAMTLGWRLAHRDRRTAIDQQAAVNFGGMGLLSLFAAASLVLAVICTVAVFQTLGDESAYREAPVCPATSALSCRGHADGQVIRKWAEGRNGPHWLEINVADRKQTIQVETAFNVWDILAPGQRVAVTSWKGHITEVGQPGGEAMQTSDSPNFALIPPIAFLIASLIGLLLFSVAAAIYRLKWKLALRGIDTSQIAA